MTRGGRKAHCCRPLAGNVSSPWPCNTLVQRFSNFFQVGTTFISQNVLRTTLILGLSNSLGPKQCSKHVFATENPSFVAESRVDRVVNFIKCQSWERKFKDACCNFQTLFEILIYSVWYAIHVNFIFSVFFGLMFNLKGPQGQNPRTTCGPRTTVWETLL